MQNIDEGRWWEQEQEIKPNIMFLDIVASYPPPYYIVAYTDVNSRLFALGTFTAEQVWKMAQANLQYSMLYPQMKNAMLEPMIITPMKIPPSHLEWSELNAMNWDLPIYHRHI